VSGLGRRAAMQSWQSENVGRTLPFLKWTGGKRALAAEILASLEYVGGRYYEPFVGGGAVFFALCPEEAILSDLNPELIECYQTVAQSPDLVAARLSGMENSEDSYYRVRNSRPTSDIGRAARFIFLTSLSFNGIYRQNLRGLFNVPYGKKSTKKLADYELLKTASAILKRCHLRTGDFEEATARAKRGDTVYFDPPYTVAHNNNGFVKYNASIFSWDDQQRLASHAAKLVERGCKVVVSNADHKSIRDLYQRFEMKLIQRNSVIAASAGFRRTVTECLFVSKSH